MLSFFFRPPRSRDRERDLDELELESERRRDFFSDLDFLSRLFDLDFLPLEDDSFLLLDRDRDLERDFVAGPVADFDSAFSTGGLAGAAEGCFPMAIERMFFTADDGPTPSFGLGGEIGSAPMRSGLSMLSRPVTTGTLAFDCFSSFPGASESDFGCDNPLDRDLSSRSIDSIGSLDLDLESRSIDSIGSLDLG